MHHSVTHACHTWRQHSIKHIIFHFISLGLDFNHRFITIFVHLLFVFYFDIISVLCLLIIYYFSFWYYFPNYYFRFIELLCSDFFIINGSQKALELSLKSPPFIKFSQNYSIIFFQFLLFVSCYLYHVIVFRPLFINNYTINKILL